MVRHPGEDRFRPRPSKPRTGKAVSRRFTSQVLRAAQTGAGGNRHRIGQAGRRRFEGGRGKAAARILASRAGPRDRRVVVKVRMAVLAKAAPGSVAAHLRYIQRDGVTPDGQPGRAYGPMTDAADAGAFEERGRGDRHQFRFIVSAEDAGEIGDLAGFTRDLMSRMEADLGTRLDWIAVDHFNTDNPHSHVVLRGVDDQGGDLLIARDYLTHGLRARASELATEMLGPQTERELRERMDREVMAERWTGLDRKLVDRAQDGLFNVAAGEERLLAGRLQTLERLGLAGWSEKRINDLSKGMQQKVQFIAAVIHRPPLLILDEPFSGLDPVNATQIKDIMLDLRDKGATIILSTHRMEQVEMMCDAICLINHGRSVLAGNLRTIKKSYGKNTVRIEYTGDGNFLDKPDLVEKLNHFGAVVEAKLRPGADPQEILKAAVARGVRLTRFELVEPPLHDIFIEKVSEAHA